MTMTSLNGAFPKDRQPIILTVGLERGGLEGEVEVSFAQVVLRLWLIVRTRNCNIWEGGGESSALLNKTFPLHCLGKLNG